ncbi:MAG: nitronate monooxygenase [Actinomycetota bacterium]|nr:nitronate monooxygenase [Actinomycetota bacterium]MDA3020819.1 nitronate monooxygenase [Actinomycetota bacterium]
MSVTPAPRLQTSLCDLVGVKYPIVQTGMGWVAGPKLVSATANAGALGILASATMDLDQLKSSIAEVKSRTTKPFGVNLRADSADVKDRISLMIDEGIKVASFAQAPKPDLISRLKDAGVVVIPSIGAKRHAEKVLEWGVDAVLVQGGEGGGHTGAVPTTILLPQVVDAVAGRVPVIAAGGFFDGRGLVAALAYGASGVAMGTRFLLTSDSSVPQAVKDYYISKGVLDTVVSIQVDGVPHRVLRTELVDQLESSRGKFLALPRAGINALKFRKMTGAKLSDMMREGLEMKKSMDLSYSQMVMAANTPMLLKTSLVDGKTESGVMASGQVVGIIDDLPTCANLIDRIITEANAVLADLAR